MRKASIQLQESDFYKSYSAVPRLLDAMPSANSEHNLLGGLAQIVESCRFDMGTRGTFCSALVATFFSILGLELFSDRRDPHTVSPNDFSLPECHLTVITDVFIDTGTLPEGAYGYFSHSLKRKKDPFLRAMRRRRGISDEFSLTFDIAVNTLHESNANLIEQQNELAVTIENQFMQSITQAEEWGDYRDIQKLQRFATMYKYGHRLMQCMDEYDVNLRNGSHASSDIYSWNDASAVLLFFSSEMMSSSQSALNRMKILSGLRRIRRLHIDSKPNRVELAKFRRFRTRILRDWKKQKYDNYKSRELQREILMTNVLSQQAKDYVSEVARNTYQSLVDECAP